MTGIPGKWPAKNHSVAVTAGPRYGANAFHRAMLDNPAFIEGRVTTNLVDRVGGAAFLASRS
jgi:hypothetical protein